MMALQTGSLVGLLPLLPLLALHRACGPCGVWTKAAAKIKALEAAPGGVVPKKGLVAQGGDLCMPLSPARPVRLELQG